MATRSRREQIENMLDFAKEYFGLQIIRKKRNGKLCLSYSYFASLPKSEVQELKLIVSCNRKDIERYLDNDPSLDEENEKSIIDASMKKRNNCFEKCPVCEMCVCEGGCFPDMDNKCKFCDVSGPLRRCRLVECTSRKSSEIELRDWKKFYDTYDPNLGALYQHCMRKMTAANAAEKFQSPAGKKAGEKKNGNNPERKAWTGSNILNQKPKRKSKKI